MDRAGTSRSVRQSQRFLLRANFCGHAIEPTLIDFETSDFKVFKRQFRHSRTGIFERTLRRAGHRKKIRRGSDFSKNSLGSGACVAGVALMSASPIARFFQPFSRLQQAASRRHLRGGL